MIKFIMMLVYVTIIMLMMGILAISVTILSVLSWKWKSLFSVWVEATDKFLKILDE